MNTTVDTYATAGATSFASAPCSWERSHASTVIAVTGGVRPVALGGRRRADLSTVPSSGIPTLSPPV